MKYRYTCFLLFILFFSIDARAQLALDDITKILKPLKTDVRSPSVELITVLDTLNDKGYVRLPDDLALDKDALCYENAIDTVRKQTIILCSTVEKDKNVTFSVTVITRDMAEFDSWLKSIRSNLDFITDKSDNPDVSKRLFKSVPTVAEKQSYEFATAVDQDTKTKKHKYLYKVTYIRHLIVKASLPAN